MKKNIFTRSLIFSLVLLISVSCANENNHSNDQFLNYNGFTIHYELYGDSNASKTLVFIHGWSGSTEVWKNQLNAFPEYRVIAIDLPGHGKSSRNIHDKYNITLFVQAVNAVLENEKIPKAFLFGHSMGFAVSEVFALKYPEKTIGIGSIDGAHFEVEKTEDAQKEWIAYNNVFAETLNEEKGREDFLNMLFLPDTPKKLKTEILESSKITPLSIGKGILSSMSDDMSYWEKRIVQIPCFVIHTQVYGLTDEYKHDFRKMYPDVQYHEIEGVSHFLMLEIPEVINILMARYLEKVY